MFLLTKYLSEFFRKIKIKKQQELDKKLVSKLSKARIPKFRQLKYFFYFLNSKERLIFTIFLGIIILSLIFLGIRVYSVHLKIYPKSGGAYTEGLIGQPKFINPVLAGNNEIDQDITQLIFSGLLKYDKSQKLVPELALDYKISDDQTIYTFRLRDNVNWHDGEKLTSQDIIFTVNLIKNEEIKSPIFFSLQGVEIEAINDYTLKFTLPKPYSLFPSILTFGILPEHIWSKIPANQLHLSEYNLKPIGNGLFKFKSLTKDGFGSIKSYTLEKNKDYFKEPFLNNVGFKFYSDTEEALSALKNKNIEGLVYFEKDWEEKLSKNKNIIKHILYLPQYTALFLNQKNNPILEDINLRKALAYAINKQEIIKEVLSGEGEIINSPIPSWLIGYNPKVEKYEFNLPKAAELLDETGWKKTEQNIRKKGDQELKLTLTTVDQTEYSRAAEIIKESWQKLGIQVELKLIDLENFQKQILKSKDYEILLYGIISGFDSDPYPFWHSSQIEDSGLNLTLFKNTKVDQLLGEARIISDEKEREKRYQEFQTILAEKLPAIFLYNPPYNYFTNKEVRGITIKYLSVPQDRFANIEEWYIKFKRRL